MSTKPLIFVYPLSATMKKLKETIEEISESEGVEVYEVDDITEVAQLVPTIGQSLSIYGAPKKCAMALKQLRKVNAKLNSKILLLNEKSIPRKTLDKFSKIGLTEFIQEPVAPKTLLYKVKLQLKSIVNDTDEFGEDDEVQSRDSSNADEESDSLYKASKSKKSNNEDDGLDYLTKKKPKSNFEIENVEKEKKKKSNYSEEDIDSHWQGKLTKEELSLEDIEEPEKAKNEEDIIDNYLRGNQEKNENELEEEEKKKRNYRDEITDENLSSNTKRDEEESEFDIRKANEEILTEIEDEKKKMKVAEEDTSTYYKGKITKDDNEDEEEEESKKRKETSILDIEDEEDFIDYEEDEELENKKKKKGLSILDIEEDSITQEKDEHEEESEKKTSKEVSVTEAAKAANESEVEHIDQEETSGEGSTDKIDKYLRGGAAKKEDEDDDTEDEKSISKDLEIDEEGEDKDLKLDEETLEEDDSSIERDNVTLDIEQSEDELTKEDINEDDDSEYSRKKKTADLLLEDGKDLEKENENEEENSKKRAINKEDLEDDKDYEDRKGSGHQEEEKKRKTHEGKVDDLTKKKLQADSKVDNIQTHYSSEKSVSHIDDDWNFEKSNKKKPEDEDIKNRPELEMSYAEKVDLGEQTIDYRKLKDEFGGVSIDREGSRIKKTGPKYYGGDSAKSKKTPSYYRDDEDGHIKSEDEEDQSEEKNTPEEIFEPNSVGLENIIRVLSFYYDSDDGQNKSFKLISSILQQNFNGELALFYYDETKARVTEASNSLNLLTDVELELKKPIWDKLFSKNYKNWKETKLPNWSDDTFQEEKIEFIYPYYEGASLMGFAVSWFTQGFQEEREKELEVSLESLRGILISNFRQSLNTGKYEGTNNVVNSPKKNVIKSFFGKLFKKKAA